MVKSTSIKSRLIVIALGIALGYLAKSIVNFINTPVVEPRTEMTEVSDIRY